MTHEYSPNEVPEEVARWLASDVDSTPPPSQPDLMDMAAWIDTPSADDRVDRLLASDAAWRRTVVDLRLRGPEEAPAEAVLPSRLAALIQDQPSVLARISGWSLAAAAAILLAIGGWHLGSQTLSGSDGETLSPALFGFDEEFASSSAGFFVVFEGESTP